MEVVCDPCLDFKAAQGQMALPKGGTTAPTTDGQGLGRPKHRVLIDSRFPPQQQQWLEERADVVVLAELADTPEARSEVEAILWYGHGAIHGDLLDTFPNLKVVRACVRARRMPIPRPPPAVHPLPSPP
jgi:hypothetical protein